MAPHSTGDEGPLQSSPTARMTTTSIPPQSLNSSKKPTLYILSEFHPTAIEHAQSLFNCILHTDPEASNWRLHATAILVRDFPITPADLDSAPQLRVIGKQGVGVEMIDVEACKQRGVRVFNTPGVNATAVAEMTLCLALSVARDVPSLVIRQRIQGEAVRKQTVSGLLLMNKTIGVVGMGNIGREVARMFHSGLKTPVVAFDAFYPAHSPGWENIPHRRVDTLHELLADADIVTVHVPLTPQTKGIISYREMQLMKPSAILLNTARGGVVDEDDLTRALEEGEIYGAGFDCHVQEPPTLEKYARLWKCPRFVGTPHIAAATAETQIATTNGATDQVYDFMQGEALS